MRYFSTIFRLALFGAFFIPLLSLAQSPRQLIIANGGNFSDTTDATTIAAWNLATNNYFAFDTIVASSVQDVLVDGQYAYVAADGMILKYDIDSYTRLHSVAAPGVRSITNAPNQSAIVAACGFPVSSDYVRIFNQSDLSEIAAVQSISGQCEGVVVVNDTAYVTVPGGFGSTTGKVALVDLNSSTLIAEIDLDTLGESVTDIFFRPADNMLYTLNALSFGSTTGVISQIPLGSRTAASTVVPYSIGFGGGTALLGSTLYGILDGAFNSAEIGGFNPYALSNAPMIPGFWAGSAMDTQNTVFYLSLTDYATWGSIHRYDASGTLIDTIAVGVAPEAFDIDGRLATGSSELFSNEVFITSYPNPFMDRVTVDASRLKHLPLSIEVFSFSGNRVFASSEVKKITEIDLSTLSAGSYLLRLHTEAGDYAQHLIRQ